MTVEFAGIKADVTALFPKTYEFLKDYEVEFTGFDRLPGQHVEIKIDREDIDFEREKSAAEDKAEGRQVRQFSDAYLETLAVARKLAESAPFCRVFLFHGSAVAVDGQAYIFTAKSGTGKSTHAALWRQLLGDRAVMINDDKPFIRIEYPEVPTADSPDPLVRPWPAARVFGSPWDGKHRISSNISMPLKAICIIERAEQNSISRISPRDAWPMLLQQTYRPIGPAAFKKTLELIDELARAAEFWRLKCNMDIEAAQIAYEAMK